MDTIYRLENTTQHYDWGSKTAMATLLGNPSPSQQPEAEMWMGVHPKGPSMVVHQGRKISLGKLVALNPEGLLGPYVDKKFNHRFPFLFKVLAAAKPLSVQAHPDKAHAQKGYVAEEERNIAPDAFNRNYKDDNHKPECICAITPFTALKGFRTIPDILHLMGKICPEAIKPEFNDFKHQPDADGLRRFYKTIMSKQREIQQKISFQAVENAKTLVEQDAFQWVMALGKYHPGDIGVLSPVLLNLILLEPGQALFLQAGELHSYLDGLGMELMASSDNVLRGGLTKKHVDVNELLNVVEFKEALPEILQPERVQDFEWQYKSAASEFILSFIELETGQVYQSSEKRSVEIFLCTNGKGKITITSDQSDICLSKGDAVLIPACSGPYHIKGCLKVYKAAVPLVVS